MTVATTIAKSGPYDGPGAGPFDYDFKIFDDSDLVVTHTDTSNVETTLTLTTDYTVDMDPDGTGTFTLVVALVAGEKVTATRGVPMTQDVSLGTQSAFFPTTHETEFDKLTMIDQQLSERLDRQLTLPVSVSASVSTELPVPQAEGYIRWNAAADAFETVFGPLNSTTFLHTGTGAVERLVVTRMQQEYHSVKDYGAIGDGATDDTSAIQAAIDAAEADGGGMVFVPPGTYLLTSTLTVPSQVILRGEMHRITTLANDANANPILELGTAGPTPDDPATASDYVRLEHLDIRGNAASTAGIMMHACNYGLFNDLYIHQVGAGPAWHFFGHRSSVEGLKIYNCKGGLLIQKAESCYFRNIYTSVSGSPWVDASIDYAIKCPTDAFIQQATFDNVDVTLHPGGAGSSRAAVQLLASSMYEMQFRGFELSGVFGDEMVHIESVTPQSRVEERLQFENVRMNMTNDLDFTEAGTMTFDAGAHTIVLQNESWETQLFCPGVRFTLSGTANNDDIVYTASAVSGDTMTVTSGPVAEAPAAGVDVTADYSHVEVFVVDNYDSFTLTNCVGRMPAGYKYMVRFTSDSGERGCRQALIRDISSGAGWNPQANWHDGTDDGNVLVTSLGHANLLDNATFIDGEAGTFCNPSINDEVTGEWIVWNADGGDTAPTVNVRRAPSGSPLQRLPFWLELDITNVGVAGAGGSTWAIRKWVTDVDDLRNRTVAFSVMLKASTNLTLPGGSVRLEWYEVDGSYGSRVLTFTSLTTSWETFFVTDDMPNDLDRVGVGVYLTKSATEDISGTGQVCVAAPNLVIGQDQAWFDARADKTETLEHALLYENDLLCYEGQAVTNRN